MHNTLDCCSPLRSIGAASLVSLCLLLWVLVSSADADEGVKPDTAVEATSTQSGGDNVHEPSATNPAGSETISSNSGFFGLIIAIISLTIISIFSLSITFWLYRWRKRFTDKYEIVVPEDWHAVSDLHNNKLNKQEVRIDQLTRALNQLGTDTGELRKIIGNMIESYLSLQGHIDTQDKEIARLREGYDAEIFRRFLNRFIRVDKAIQGYVDEGAIDLEGLDQIKKILEDAFNECGLKVLEPRLGQDYAQTDGVADNPRKIPNQDPALVGKIAEVRECGYQLQETGKIVQAAKVSVFGPVN